MPSPTIILGILLALSVLGNLGLAKLYVSAKSDLAAETARFSAFKAGVKTEGEKAAKDAKDKEAADLKLKKETDDEHVKKVAGLNTSLERLRRNRISPGGGIVPAAPSTTKRPEIVAFDRAEFDRAFRGFEEGLEGLLGEGAKAVVNMDSALKWATELRR